MPDPAPASAERLFEPSSESANRFRWFGLGIVALIFALSIYVIHDRFSGLGIRKIYVELAHFPHQQILWALAGVGISFLAISFYDWLALRYVEHRLPYRKTAFAALTAYALANALGRPPLTGGAVRLRLYGQWGLKLSQITVLAIVTGVTFCLGALAITGMGLLLEAPRFERLFQIPIVLTHLAGFVALTLVGLFLWQARATTHNWTLRASVIPRPGLPTAAAQLFASIVDWSAAGFVFYCLLPADIRVNYFALLPIFVIACFLGGVSGLPGGIGVFEAIIVLTIGANDHAELAVSLILFRILYYLVPLAIAAAWLALYEARAHIPGLRQGSARAAASFAPGIFSLIAFSAGIFMLVSAVTPALAGPLRMIGAFLPLPLIELSHFMASIVGVLLLLVAIGLGQRLDHAWTFAVILLSIGTGLTIFKGAGLHEAAILVGALTLILPTRQAFYRTTPLTHANISAPWILAILATIGAALWLGFFSYAHEEYRNELWWSFTLNGESSRFLRAAAGICVLCLIFSLWRWLRPKTLAATGATPVPAAQIKAILNQAQTGHADGALALLGDKQFHLSPSGQSFVMYGMRGRNWIVMGEPVGREAEIDALLWSFRELADKHGAAPIFYAVRKEFLPRAVELGLVAQKIGEAAVIALDSFGLEGPARSGLRNVHRRAGRDGLRFEMVAQEELDPILPDLQIISDQWLARHGGSEKGFTLGRFDRDYLRNFPTAIVRRQTPGETDADQGKPDRGKIVAFTNVWLTPNHNEISIDLMRFGEAAPKGVMDYLFIELMLWGKANQYRLFDLGMAPLSGLEGHRLAPLLSQLGALIFEHGNKIYGFEGLRAYKKKFDPIWEPLYLAAPGRLMLPMALADVALLTSGGLTGLMKKTERISPPLLPQP